MHTHRWWNGQRCKISVHHENSGDREYNTASSNYNSNINNSKIYINENHRMLPDNQQEKSTHEPATTFFKAFEYTLKRTPWYQQTGQENYLNHEDFDIGCLHELIPHQTKNITTSLIIPLSWRLLIKDTSIPQLAGLQYHIKRRISDDEYQAAVIINTTALS